ncbi:MAG: hypothetical protein U0414_25010 [Polyangiaceae bacterium]
MTRSALDAAALRWASRPTSAAGIGARVVTAGEDLLLVAVSEEERHVSVARLVGEWPPEVEPLASHPVGGLGAILDEVIASPDRVVACSASGQAVVMHGGTWSRFRGAALAFERGTGGLYSARVEGTGTCVVEHRAAPASGAAPRELGRFQAHGERVFGCALEDGGYLIGSAAPGERVRLYRADARARFEPVRADVIAVGDRHLLVTRRGGAWWVSGTTSFTRDAKPIRLVIHTLDGDALDTIGAFELREREERPCAACVIGDDLAIATSGLDYSVVVTMVCARSASRHPSGETIAT